MTLHWWMHWFWVTALLLLHASSVKSFAWPQTEEELQQITSTPERRARAMYYSKPPAPLNTTSPPPPQQLASNETKINTTQWTSIVPVNITDDNDYLTQTNNINATDIEPTHTDEDIPNIHIDSSKIDKDSSKIGTDSPIIGIDSPDIDKDSSNIGIDSSIIGIDNTDATLNVTVIPVAKIQNVTTNGTRKRNLTRQEYVKDESGVRDASESKIVTEKPLSLETSFLQTRIPPKEVFRRTSESSSGLDAGAVFGLSFGAVGLGALCASTAFVLYRRRYLNKPQTLHDKCSDRGTSSPYLDDSTVRDNSEEMYSLDNDSFLNSLEAMTIQNYWTDTVKHTKL